MTLDEHIARLKTEFPTLTATEDGQERTLSPEEYEARIAEWAANEVARDAEEQEQAERAELRRIVAAYLDTLDANETQLVAGIAALRGQHPTLPQPTTIAALRNYVTAMAEMTLDHNRGIERLIRYLVRTGVIGT